MKKNLLLLLTLTLTLPVSTKSAGAAEAIILETKGQPLRVRCISHGPAEYDVVFEQRVADNWEPRAQFPSGQAWNIHTDWRDSWYAEPHPAKVQKVEMLPGSRLRASAVVDVAGQRWWLADIYSLEHGMVRIDRSFGHCGPGTQSKITLETRIRLPLGTDQRMLMPGVLYNNNPGSTLVGTRISTEPGGLGLYEEHRLPVPMVHVESVTGGGSENRTTSRTYGSLVTQPSRILQGHKGGDHWWSLGLEYGRGYVDLLSVSGPVATNGKKSQIYGHRHGFDTYDDAYLDVQGPAVFEKTLYLDLGSGIKTGYGFRETLWKAFEVFQPVATPHVPFAEAMTLVAEYAKSRFYQAPADPQYPQNRPVGYRWFPKNDVFQYGWCGGNLGLACGLLEYADRTGDAAAREQAIQSIQFFIHGAQAEAEGLFFGDYNLRAGRWIAAGFDQSAPGISSRQLGDNLEHLTSLVELGWKLRLPEADPWLAALRKSGDFLLRSPRCRGMFPRAWTPQGTALGWPLSGEAPPGALSMAGAQCIYALARLAVMTGERKYLEVAVDALEAYWREFGETLAQPYWGATLDAGAEDKEAGWIMMRAALEVYSATQDRRFLEMAKDAADWTLTWMYFHQVPLKPESGLLHDHVNTIGWTFISTQNQEIDVFGYFMAPDFYRLGVAANDTRYQQIGRVLFAAATQTISRPGAMFGPVPGIQAEHYNHSNCTYVGGQPGTWRGSQHSMGIAWTMAGALYSGSRLMDLGPWEFFYGSRPASKKVLRYEFLRKQITVDGDPSDWEGVKENVVEGPEHLWFGQGMTSDKWHGNQDLSFRWRGAWDGDQLSFLVVVTDDHLIDPPRQPKSWLNDCIEIHLDPLHLGGPRKERLDGMDRLRGYEMHFVPATAPVIFVDDVLAPTYPMDKPQNDLFQKKWKGKMAVKKTPAGYIVEIAFCVPGLRLSPGMRMGLDMAVCDADGQSRKALQIWSGNRGEFWLNMDDHPEVTLVESYAK